MLTRISARFSGVSWATGFSGSLRSRLKSPRDVAFGRRVDHVRRNDGDEEIQDARPR
jgi:hypothetical protein